MLAQFLAKHLKLLWVWGLGPLGFRACGLGFGLFGGFSLWVLEFRAWGLRFGAEESWPSACSCCVKPVKCAEAFSLTDASTF